MTSTEAKAGAVGIAAGDEPKSPDPLDMAGVVERLEADDDHVSFFVVPLIALAAAFGVSWGAVMASAVFAIMFYGVTGRGIDLLPYRVAAIVFTAVFVVVTALGWASWASHHLRRARALSPTVKG